MRRLDDLVRQLKGLVYMRALLESGGASVAALAAHTDAIAGVHAELGALATAERGEH